MSAFSTLKLVLIVLLLFSLEISARRRTGPRHKGRPIERDGASVHERLLKAAGCTNSPPKTIEAPKSNVWSGLQPGEDHDMHLFLSQQLELNLNNRSGPPPHNLIFNYEAIRPNKSDVLRYLDGSGPLPERYASAWIDNAETDPENPTLTPIIIGPLPVSNKTTWQPLWYPFTRKTPIRQLRSQEYLNPEAEAKWYNDIVKGIHDICLILWNSSCTGDNARVWYDGFGTGMSPEWQYDDKITVWSQFHHNQIQGTFDTYDLLPLGLFLGSEFDLQMAHPETWKFKGWVYNNVLYKTTEEFREAFFSPGFQRLGANRDGPWAWTDHVGPGFPLDTEAPPTPVGGKKSRFSIDLKENYVEWMGFSFYFVNDYYGGITLFDIRFKGERIIYELGIQQVVAHYAGIDPVHSGTAYLDGDYGFGGDAISLMPGYDCPTYATYLNYTSYSGSVENALCLFEFDADYPMQRHAYLSNTKNVYFAMRTVNLIGNYDYLMTWEFYMDGSIQLVARAAGYIESSFYAAQHDYGYHIHNSLSGSMHDHVFNVKVDFDILGTDNTMELVTFTPTTENYVWSDQPRNTMKLIRRDVTSEDESRLMWTTNGATQYRIVNKDKPNPYGEYRGYRIAPSMGSIHLTVQNSSNLVKLGNLFEHDIAVTKRKDTEPKGFTPFDDQDVYDPMVDFDKFFDGESLEQEDLVVWFNMGMHHIPHTGDLPNTVYTTARSAVQIIPSNYFLRDQSRDTVNMVQLMWKDTHFDVKYFGQHHQVCSANLSALPDDYDDYGYFYK